MKRGTPDHPKVAQLASLLNINKAWAVGILELLWHFTAKYAPQGDIGKYTDAAIAEAVGWQRPTGERGVTPQCRLSDALVEAKWLDRCPCHRLVVHDWPSHADQSVTRFLTRHELDFVHPKASLPLPLPLPKPLPIAVAAPVAGCKPNEPPGFHTDELYPELLAAYEAWGTNYVKPDFTGPAWHEWKLLDFTQKRAAIAGIKARHERGDDPAFAPNPTKYLRGRESEWNRKQRPEPMSAAQRRFNAAFSS